ncbi:hypothetical protein CJ217_01770 [Streptococcus sp. UMB1385]|nr:hypothetical protein CJ217_01770 [Streptococcus sp. UMB1385]
MEKFDKTIEKKYWNWLKTRFTLNKKFDEIPDWKNMNGIKIEVENISDAVNLFFTDKDEKELERLDFNKLKLIIYGDFEMEFLYDFICTLKDEMEREFNFGRGEN